LARERLLELRLIATEQVHALLRDVPVTLEVSRRCVANLKQQLPQL